jgi:putative oxidoreductase
MGGRAAEWTHATLRMAAGLLFMQHGMQKLFGVLGGMGAPGAAAPLASLMGVAGILEFTGGLLIAMGLAVRPVAMVLLLEMMSAYVIAHIPRGAAPIENGGELALLYAAVFLFLAAHGAGPLSVDEWVSKRTHQERRHFRDRRAHAIV